MPRRDLCLLPCLLATSCLQALAPDVGPLTPVQVCNDDLDPAQTVSFSADIMPIFLRVCDECHVPGGEGTVRSGLSLLTYASLRAGGTRSVSTIVVDRQPCASVLWQKVSPSPPFGLRMPKDLLPLSMAEIDQIHDWIAEGALEN